MVLIVVGFSVTISATVNPVMGPNVIPNTPCPDANVKFLTFEDFSIIGNQSGVSGRNPYQIFDFEICLKYSFRK